MGTVELTGLAMTPMRALGATLATASARSRTIEAFDCDRRGNRQEFVSPRTGPKRLETLTLKRSSRVIPGLRGIPAGMMTSSAPSRAFSRPLFSGAKPTHCVARDGEDARSINVDRTNSKAVPPPVSVDSRQEIARYTRQEGPGQPSDEGREGDLTSEGVLT